LKLAGKFPSKFIGEIDVTWLQHQFSFPATFSGENDVTSSCHVTNEKIQRQEERRRKGGEGLKEVGRRTRGW
ncbi:MAG: hypothetical protein O7C62_04780, partial [Rickettsia endosymbiont of Ixodes persulcatus]|nr:hypothetical protein [Rickettsia endosymbiont of Ixodes persulcatus]